MAMHGDGCFMCSPAMDQLRLASERLNCTRFGSPSGKADESEVAHKRCQKHQKLPNVKPILLQVSVVGVALHDGYLAVTCGTPSPNV